MKINEHKIEGSVFNSHNFQTKLQFVNEPTNTQELLGHKQNNNVNRAIKLKPLSFSTLVVMLSEVLCFVSEKFQLKKNSVYKILLFIILSETREQF
jgi:hypothetical protein